MKHPALPWTTPPTGHQYATKKNGAQHATLLNAINS